MSWLRALLVGLVVFGPLACADWGSGCSPSPLDQPLAPERVAPRAVELYLPQERLAGLGPELLAALQQSDAARLEADVPAVGGQLDAETAYALPPVRIDLALDGLEVDGSGGGLGIGLSLVPASLVLQLEVSHPQAPAEVCNLDLFVPARSAWLHLVLGADEDGAVGLQLDGTPRLSGEPLELLVEPGCALASSEAVAPAVIEALDAALQQALVEWIGSLLAVCERALGVGLGAAGELQDVFRFSLRPVAPAAALGDGGMRLALAGGFESQRAACVSADLAERPPPADDPAAFDERLPGSGAPYGLAVAVSRGYLEQGLIAAQRSGLLCRRSGSGDLSGVDPAGVLSSLQALGPIDAVRAAVWPQGPAELSWGEPQTDLGERLPRLLVLLPATRLDVYARLDGTDLRVLGLSADVTLVLAPLLEGHRLTMQLAEVQTAGLAIEFSELVTEKAGELQQAAKDLLRQVGTVLIERLGPLPLDLPSTAGPELQEYRLDGDRLLLYF